jgi:hypothetical protein
LASPDFTLFSLRGGLNDSDPAPALNPDDCTVAENVEFVYSTLGERRLGCTAISLPTSITADANMTAVTWMHRHLPTSNEGAAELWVLAQNLAGSQYVLTRRNQTVWTTIPLALDTLTVNTPFGHRISATSLHGKLFFAFNTDQDILHVWDGTTLRRVGMGTPAAPTAVDTGVAGAFAGTRYYRIRYTVMSGTTVLRRSEPGATLTFAPSGTKTGAVVTKPASIGESETHWEIEASTDNANFYRLAQTVVGTTTYTDTVALGTGYATSGTLSADTGDYTRIPSGKFLVSDDDRLVIAGSWENADYASRIWWTPVYGDTTGVGNDERLEMDTDPFLDLDGFQGGELTALSKSINGYIFAFKWGHIYKVVRKGQRTQAYEAFPLTKVKGALPGSVVEAFDEGGNPSLFFLDPKTGPHRIGKNGIEWAGRDIQTFWATVNKDATVPCFGLYYPEKRQVHYWVATGSANYPDSKIIVQTNEMRSTDQGARRGWSTVPSGNRIADAHCGVLFSTNVDTANSRNQTLVPFIGKTQWTVNAVTIKDLVQQCDTGQTDAFTSGDTTAAYTAKVRSKPFLTAGLLQKHGVQACTLLAKANSSQTDTVYVKVIRDFGKDTSPAVTTTLVPSGSETDVIKELDNLSFSELKAMQVEFGDSSTPTNQWRLNGFAAKIRREETQ